MSSDSSKSHEHEDELRLMHIVAMFQFAAMQQMGKFVNPATNEMERDLQQARASIDMVETIKRKTEGNRSHAETEFVDKVLFELHMNYVEETRKTEGDRETGESESQATGDDAQPSGADGSDETPSE